jgi:peptidoglycan/xylan/chitin deacetylase (PgdA/CDA1 family)
LDLPCTFYVTTGFIESNGSSWIDKIEAVVETAATVRLDLPFPDLTGVFTTGQEKRHLLDRIRQIVKADRNLVADEFAAEVTRQIGAAPANDQQLDKKMTWNQVRELGQNKLFTIGGHGQTHRILSYLDGQELDEEIEGSLSKLQTQLGAAIEHYSYPEGLNYCYSDRVINVLREQGVVCSPTAEGGINRVGDDLFRLKRIMVN